MKGLPAILVAVVLVATTMTCAEEMKLDTEQKKLSYAFGIDIGTMLKRLDTDVDLDAFTRAIKDTMQGDTLLMTAPEAEAVKEQFAKRMQEEQEKKMTELAGTNQKEGAAFLADNAKTEGVQTTASGLQYKVVTAGTGAKPKETDRVKVNYRGTLIDGSEFDSSYKRGEPAVFQVGGVIPGWVEALQLMPVGSKWQLFIPADLAYGERGAGGVIGPNATLIFDVELLGIEQ